MKYKIIVKTYEDDNLLYSEQTTGTIDMDYLEFNTDNDNIRINLDNFSFTKKSSGSILRITENKCLLKIKELKDSIEIPIDYINFQNDNNKDIMICYKLASQENKLTIKINIGDELNEL